MTDPINIGWIAAVIGVIGAVFMGIQKVFSNREIAKVSARVDVLSSEMHTHMDKEEQDRKDLQNDIAVIRGDIKLLLRNMPTKK